MIVATPARAELRKHTSILQQSAALAVSLVFLAMVVPVLIAEHEIRLAGQGQQRDFVQDRLEPESLDNVLYVSFIVITARILFWGELDLDVLCWFEAEGL
jgi:hypothetical protein